MNIQIITKYPLLFLLLVSVTHSCQTQIKENIPWNYLIKQDLSGWQQLGGKATYTLKDNIIIGTTVDNQPNSFLTTEKQYEDFILELEYKVDSTINSGIQIRSNSIAQYQNGRVHGYQVEIDPSARAWSGGIYDEGRRGWLNTLEKNPAAQKAFKQNDWNKYRIEAIGDTIKTWVNGTPAAYLIDTADKKGFIALQVHSIESADDAGKKIMWRDVKILTDSLSKYTRTSTLTPINLKNALTANEKEAGWKLLWDGKTTEGWRGGKLDKFPDQGWEIKSGKLSVLPSGGGESEAGGDIVTVKQYGDFELMVDFKLTEGANSGIKYYVDTELNKGAGSSIGLEYQILDDKKHPDAKLGAQEGSRTVASLYDLIQADPAKPIKPVGEWNTAHIVSKNDSVTHWLNGVKVLAYNRRSSEFLQLVEESKYKDWPNFGQYEKGNILLQDHGDYVSFKNIKIKTLKQQK